ncbi:hypothetical protein CROQUDRAFT_246323 [Cronartium quercuum f. sp. fusiforme G11]|uniref:Uncharacterized protein n=1 Tax=Cronartium quercuum f. sp. fusiforme G11 TaxID=708437 RepID=A0A9P6TF64_9BASI|nr:hypothetical protein CROQUDRAFT_246323 [Cronartium quercuum f. sp. fusiforme G11]
MLKLCRQDDNFSFIFIFFSFFFPLFLLSPIKLLHLRKTPNPTCRRNTHTQTL